jgi:hypothetical protein
MGGDVLAGTNFVDALKIFEHDDDTEGIVLIGEIGGTAELEAAEWIKDYKMRSSNPKYTSHLNFRSFVSKILGTDQFQLSLEAFMRHLAE